MSNRGYGGYGGYGYGYQSSMQKNAYELKLDQTYSYGVMGNVFSALECYANKSSPNKPPLNNFGYYNNFNSGNIKTLEQLKDQIITQLEIFKYSYQIYKKEHSEYHFPKNMKKEQIIKIIGIMKEYVKENDKKYYDAVLEIINSKNVSYVNETINKSLLTGADPYHANQGFIIGDGGYATSISQKIGEEIKRQYSQNPNFEPQLNLNQTSPFPLPKTSIQRQIDNLVEELIKNCEELESNNYSYYSNTLRNKINEIIKMLETLRRQNPTYYYNNRNLNGIIDKMEKTYCPQENKEIFTIVCYILKDIQPKDYR